MKLNKRKVAATRFREFISRSNELHREYLEDSSLLENYGRFTEWQLDYFLPFFGDLRDQEGYADAIDFVVTDMAGVGISSRDRDLERVAPTMSALLPLKALDTLASAAEANARILKINIAICRCLLVDNKLPSRITEADYCIACRDASTIDECLELIRVVVELGKTLDGLVRSSMLDMTLRAMRGPANAAGFGALHEFLETGFTTFRQIPDINEFLDEFEKRAVQVFEHIYIG